MLVSRSSIASRLLLTTILSASVSAPAFAQDATDDEVQASNENIIIVTAQKREQNLNEVPISIAVVGGDDLNSLNLNEATDLQFLVPGLGLGDANNPRGAGLRLRGIGTAIFADGIEQSVGTVVDGVPLARAGQGLADLIDIERVEVLRGPQGMLFGRNASAGVISIVTKKPSLSGFGLDAQASYGEDNDLRVGASVTAPIAEDVAGFRLTGFFNQRDGYVTNLATGIDLNDRKDYGVRGSLLIEPSADLEIILRGDWSKRDNRANAILLRSLNPASSLATPIPLAPGFVLPPVIDPAVQALAGPDNTTVSIGGNVFNKVESWGVSGELNYGLGDYTLTAITAYRKWDQFDNGEADNSVLNLLDTNPGSNDLYQFSQEVRLTSPEDQLVSFVAGLFYYESSNENTSSQIGKFVPAFAQFGAAGIPVPVPGTPIVVQPADLVGYTATSDVDVRDFAAFGQATVNLSDSFKVLLGARYTNTEVSAQYARNPGAGTAPFPNLLLGSLTTPVAYDESVKDNNFSWRVGLQYQPNPDLNLFATVSRGYKGPGFDTQISFSVPTGQTALQAALVNPEIPTNYEVGAKGSFAGGLINASLTFFLTDFEDYQAQIFETPPGALLGSFRVRNAGNLRTQGVELEVNANPADGFTAGFSLAYTDTEFTDFVGAACPRAAQTTPGNVCFAAPGVPAVPSFDASGVRAPNAPQLTLALNSRYEAPVSDTIDFFIQANMLLRGDATFSVVPNGSPDPYQQDGYAVVNGSIGLRADGGRYGISVFVKNLFDKNYVTSIFDLPFGGGGDLGQFSTRDAQRLIGVKADVSF